MANKVQNAIENSKRKRDFKARQKRRFETKGKKSQNERDTYVQRKRPRKDEAEVQDSDYGEEDDDKLVQVMDEQDVELEQEVARDQAMEDEANFDDTEFLQHGEDLDLPDSEQDEEELDRDAEGGETDYDLEDYYKELGIEDEEDLTTAKKKKGTSGEYKTKKKLVPAASKAETIEQQREKVLETLIKRTRDTPNYNSLNKVIKIVKQVFNVNQQSKDADDEEEDA